MRKGAQDVRATTGRREQHFWPTWQRSRAPSPHRPAEACSGLLRHRMCRQRRAGSFQGVIGGQIRVEEVDHLGGGGITVSGSGPHIEHGQGGDAFAQIRARGLARLRGRRGEVDDVIGELEGHADAFAETRTCVGRIGSENMTPKRRGRVSDRS